VTTSNPIPSPTSAGSVLDGDPRILIPLPEAAERLGISRWQAYKLARSGRLPTTRLGARDLPGHADPRTTRRYDRARRTSTKRLPTPWPPTWRRTTGRRRDWSRERPAPRVYQWLAVRSRGHRRSGEGAAAPVRLTGPRLVVHSL
jgi:hypothetical protein